MSTLTPHQKFALNQYLHSYPSDWSYDQITDFIYDNINETYHNDGAVVLCEDFEDYTGGYLVHLIDNMITDLEFMFPVDNSKQ